MENLGYMQRFLDRELDAQKKAQGQMTEESAAAKPNMRQDVFSLSEGEVSIRWPASLSPESYEDVCDWLDILKRKMGRSKLGLESEQT